VFAFVLLCGGMPLPTGRRAPWMARAELTGMWICGPVGRGVLPHCSAKQNPIADIRS